MSTGAPTAPSVWFPWSKRILASTLPVALLFATLPQDLWAAPSAQAPPPPGAAASAQGPSYAQQTPGGVDIPSQLIELGLVDEFHFVVQPMIAGEGRRLLEGITLQERLQLKLVESKILNSGCVALHYLKQ